MSTADAARVRPSSGDGAGSEAGSGGAGSGAGGVAAGVAGAAGAKPGIFARAFRGMQTNVLQPTGKVVLLDAIVGALLLVREGVPGLQLNVPIADTAMLVLVAIALFRRPKFNNTATTMFGLAGVALLTFLVLVTFLGDGDFVRRAARIAGLFGLAIFLADGRIDVRSLAFGLGLGLLVNAGLFYTGLAPAPYGEYLTGFIGDKNVSGLYYAVFALILAGLATSRAVRWIIIGVGILLVVLTGSRTSLAAIGAGIVWFAATPKLPFLFRGMLGAGLFFAFEYAENNFSQLSFFGDREGTDALRGRIDDASLAKVEATPWHGMGLGTATAEVDERVWFFHNSYWALIVEGGWVFLVGMLAIYAFVVFFPTPLSGVRTLPRVAIEAAAIALLLCAFRLGEVFITIPSFVMLGAALFLLAEDRALVETSDGGGGGLRAPAAVPGERPNR